MEVSKIYRGKGQWSSVPPGSRISYILRKAAADDVPIIKWLLDHNKEIFGFIPRPAIERSIAKGEIYVIELKQLLPCLDGFCRFHRRRDGLTVVYEIFVRGQCRRMGLASAMIRELKGCVKVKCPVDLDANDFYRAMGFKLANVEIGKKQRLNVWVLA